MTGRRGTQRPRRTAATKAPDRRASGAVPSGPAARRWLQIRENLARTLHALGDGEFLILCHTPWNYYVQFSGEGRQGLWAEVSSNQYVHPDHRLTAAQTRKLRALGWNRPNLPPPELAKSRTRKKGSPNFYREVKRPVDWQALARLTVETMQLLGVTEPRGWEYDCFTSDGREIRFPQLGLRRRPPRRDAGGWRKVWVPPGSILLSKADLPHRKARELLRLWIADGRIFFASAPPSVLGEPEHWGQVLFAVGRHIADAYRLERRRSVRRSLERLLNATHDAWRSWQATEGSNLQ